MNDSQMCGEKSRLIDYLYGEASLPDRRQFEQHLAECASCRDELTAFRGVRNQLAAADQEISPGVMSAPWEISPGVVSSPRVRWWQQVPVWAQLAAAMLLFITGASLANLEVRWGPEGLVVRTGWSHAGQPAPAAVDRPSALTSGGSSTTAGALNPASAPWRSDLVTLERQLRTEFRTSVPSPTAQAGTAAARDDELLRRVRALIDASEQRQQRELALRLASVVRDFDAQRRTDMLRIADGLGQVEGRTGAAVLQQRQLLNYLMTVSQKQER